MPCCDSRPRRHCWCQPCGIAGARQPRNSEPLLLPALGCFAVAVPASIALVVLSQVIYELAKDSQPDVELGSQNWPALSVVLAVVDQIACYLGFLLIFWSFHWITGMIFLVATLIAFATIWLEERHLRNRNTAKETLENA